MQDHLHSISQKYPARRLKNVNWFTKHALQKIALICNNAMEDLSPFIENINRKIKLLPENMELVTASFKVVKVKKKQMLIQPGFVAKYRIYVLKGAFHSYVIDDKGNEHTIQFAVDDWWLSDYNSYVHQTPATQFVEALENSVILQID